MGSQKVNNNKKISNYELPTSSLCYIGFLPCGIVGYRLEAIGYGVIRAI
jgi:hypothetical protein